MKIALVWPKSTFLIDPMVYPPLGLLYVWSALLGAGFEVEYFDLSVDSEDTLNSFDQVWVSGTTPQVSELRRLGRSITTKTVLGGPHAWLKGKEMLDCYDLVVKGEIFDPFVAAIVVAEPGHYLDLGLRTDLRGVTPPNRLAALRYRAQLQGRSCTTMMSSLGCPYHCAFCSSQQLWGRVRYLDMPSIRRDIFEIEQQGFGAVQFYDDILPIRPERAIAIGGFLWEDDLIWRCFMRSDLGVRHGKEFLIELARLGLVEVLVGIESGSQQIKDNINKGTTVEQDTLFRTWCRDVGISFKASVILGLPGETLETMEETRKWLLENQPDRADINFLIPMPGTPLYEGGYDCQWSCPAPDEYFFKGKPGELKCLVRTAALSSQEISEFRNTLVEELAVPY